ncbi:TetR/AcrR family transcriptional regulator [Microbacterium sp. 1P10UB]|uniref:TetR/AcrR family transcriptional regulator n=1 Tax=unclassified Microbacterium TaxID=2609290 RepID=UPI0039A1EB3E
MATTEKTGAAGRPRDPEVERSILIATQDLLLERGYAGTTIAGVAQRARCGKSAIYRRWDSKPELVVAAVRASQQPSEIPDTGDLREDLLAAALHFADAGDRSGLVLARVLSEIGRDSELYAAAHRVIGGPPVATLVSVIEQWIRRGVVSADVPVDLIAGIVPTAAFGSVTMRQRALEREVVTALIDSVVIPALSQQIRSE